jgi:uncharacterized membrane protein
MNQDFWLRIHGGVTHFPIVLLFVSVLLDAIGLCWIDKTAARGLHAAAGICASIATLACFAAVASGLLISRWKTLGTGSLLRHHLYVWPGFAIAVALMTWRLTMRGSASSRAFLFYLGGMGVASLLMFGAGYWGGEMVLAGELGR